MTSIAEKMAKLRQLKQQTNIIKQQVAEAKAKITTSAITNNSIEYMQSNEFDDETVSRYTTPAEFNQQAISSIVTKQQELNTAIQRQRHVDDMVSSIISNMPKMDYEAEAARLILRDGKTNLADAIKHTGAPNLNTNQAEHKKIHLDIDLNNIASIKRITVQDGPDDATDGELTDLELSDDDSIFSDNDSTDGIEIDESRYPHLDPIRTRPCTPELDAWADNLTNEEIQLYVRKEYERSIKIVKCWCIMSNNAGYQLFNSAEVDIIKKHLSSYQLIPLANRSDIDRVDWPGMFIQWLYIDADSYNGARCRFGRGWVLQYYPNYSASYSNQHRQPRLVVSTKYQPDFTNDKRTSAIYASGYTQSICLDGKTPVFRHITAGDVALASNGC